MNQVIFGKEAKTKLLSGINKLNEAVSTTLGPGGRNVIYSDENGDVRSTKDGVTVAKMIKQVEDPVENMGIQLLKQASIRTANAAGDGTTTATLLATELINGGFQAIQSDANSVSVKRGIDKAIEQVIDYIKDISVEISSPEQLEQVATISANGDVEVGKIISLAMEKVGREGVVTIEESKTGETYLETVEGMQFDRGYKSPYFVNNNNNMTCNLENPYVLLYDKKIVQIKELLPILDFASKQDRSILIVAEDIEHEALATLLVNKMRGILKVCAVKAPDFGDRRLAILQDIAVLTNGVVVSPDKGMKLEKFLPEWLGECKTANVSKNETTIVDGSGTEENIIKRVEEIKTQIDKSESLYEKEQLQNRLAKMAGGVAIIYVGAHTEIELKEKKDRVDDALHATKAAVEEGIIPGGGTALLRASRELTFDKKNRNKDEYVGFQIVRRTLVKPFVNILNNVGLDTTDEVYQDKVLKGKDSWFGFNPKTNKYGNMLEFGILDPVKVTRCALENAASIAATILLTDGVIYTEPKGEDTQVENANPFGGMM